MKILGIETSCDETAISIVEAKGGFKHPSFKILSNIVASQISIHKKWGGVVPHLAKREHQKNLIPVLEKALKKAKLLNSKLKTQTRLNKSVGRDSKLQLKSQNQIKKILEREPELLEHFLDFVSKIQVPKIDAIAVTIGPGLEPALWVGINFAKALSKIWNKPVIAVNHMEGHLLSFLLSQKAGISHLFPAIALLVSGGHTELVLVKDWLKYKLIGQTRDDAAGEAFDKVARMLNLGYPGGPIISQLADKCKKERCFEKISITLPRPMIDSSDLDFSFSGLKTAVLYLIQSLSTPLSSSPTTAPSKRDRNYLVHSIVSAKKHLLKNDLLKERVAYEFQQAVIDVLVSKTLRAVEKYKSKTVILGGGVAANKELRQQLKKAVKKLNPEIKYLTPSLSLTTDNAAMIAVVGYFHSLKGNLTKNLNQLKAKGNLTIN